MSDGRNGNQPGNDVSGAPIDFDRLNVIVERFAMDDRFTRIDVSPEFARDRIVCYYDPGLYIGSVQSARQEIVWFENGDFRSITTKSTRMERSTADGIATPQITTRVTTFIRAQTRQHPVTTRHTRRSCVTF